MSGGRTKVRRTRRRTSSGRRGTSNEAATPTPATGKSPSARSFSSRQTPAQTKATRSTAYGNMAPIRWPTKPP